LQFFKISEILIYIDQAPSRTHLKNVFWPNIFVGASLQILDIQQYASGLKLGPAARVPAKPLGEDGILNQNPIFEMGSIY
jgi:hypothetical protein